MPLYVRGLKRIKKVDHERKENVRTDHDVTHLGILSRANGLLAVGKAFGGAFKSSVSLCMSGSSASFFLIKFFAFFFRQQEFQ